MTAQWSHTINARCCSGYGRCGRALVWKPVPQDAGRVVCSPFSIMDDSNNGSPSIKPIFMRHYEGSENPVHSPAPWRIEDIAQDGEPVLMLIAADGKRIAEICWQGECPDEETEEELELRQQRDEANDHLLQAAPDLLALAYDYEETCVNRIGNLHDELRWRGEDEWRAMVGHWTVQLNEVRWAIDKAERR